MESLTPQPSDDADDDEFYYVIVVTDKTDEQEQQPENIGTKKTPPMVQIAVSPENSVLICSEEIKEESDDLEDQYESIVDENILDENYMSDEQNKKKYASWKEYKTHPLPSHMQNSFVRELCHMNPELKDDEEALIHKLYKIMKDTHCPPPPHDFMVEGKYVLKCANCGYTVKGKKYSHEAALARHWQLKHGPRYLKCLACGADFNWPSSLYGHEKTCKSPDAWLVLKARDRVMQRKSEFDKCGETSKEVERSKASERLAAKSKVSEQPIATRSKVLKRPITTKSKASQRSIRAKESGAAKRPMTVKSDASKRLIDSKRKASERPAAAQSKASERPIAAQSKASKRPSTAKSKTSQETIASETSEASKQLTATKSKAKQPVTAKSKTLKRPVAEISQNKGPSKKVPKLEVAESGPDSKKGLKNDPDLVEIALRRLLEGDISDTDQPAEKSSIEEEYLSDKDFDSDPQYKPIEDETSDPNSSNESDIDDPLDLFERQGKKPKSKGPQGVNKSIKKESGQRESYLNNLRKERPDLLKDEKLLIQTLSDIMAKEKPPDPPEEFATLNSDALYECGSCDYKNKSKVAAARHWQMKHGTQCFKCYACPAQFRDHNSLYRHEKICMSPYTYLVLKARARTIMRTGRNNRPFLDDPDIQPRKRYQHIVNKATGCYICSLCPREFPTLHDVKAHENEHRGGPPTKPTFQCKECKVVCGSVSALCHHRTRKHHTEEGIYMCDKCDRTFTNKTDIRRHTDTHSTIKKHACSECERRFAHRTDLKIHIDRDHRKLPHPFECHLCPQRYPRMTLLRKHMLKRHGMNIVSLDQAAANASKRFVCPKCSKRYAEKKDLTYHIDRVHYNRPPPFACPICPQRFSKRTYVTDHAFKKHEIEIDEKSVVNTWEEPEKTDGNAETYYGAEEIVSNTPIRTEVEKIFTCAECGKRYAHKNDLRHHIDRVHNNMPLPFACQLCPKRCSKMVVLENHLWKCHQMKIIPRKAFLENLPNLTEEQLRSAITVKKSDIKPGKNTINYENNINTGGPTELRVVKENLLMNEAEVPKATHFETIDIQHTETTEKEVDTIVNEIDEKDQGCDVEENEVEINNEEECEEIVEENEVEINKEQEYEEIVEENEEEINNEEIIEEYEEIVEEYLDETDDEEGTEVEEPPEDLIEIVKRHENDCQRKKPLIVIKDGQAVFLDGDSVGYFKKTSNCKINKKISAVNEISDTNKELLSYYDRFCKQSDELSEEVVQQRKSTRSRKPNSKWTHFQ